MPSTQGWLTLMMNVVIPWSSFISRFTRSTRFFPGVLENACSGGSTSFTLLLSRALRPRQQRNPCTCGIVQQPQAGQRALRIPSSLGPIYMDTLEQDTRRSLLSGRRWNHSKHERAAIVLREIHSFCEGPGPFSTRALEAY